MQIWLLGQGVWSLLMWAQTVWVATEWLWVNCHQSLLASFYHLKCPNCFEKPAPYCIGFAHTPPCTLAVLCVFTTVQHHRFLPVVDKQQCKYSYCCYTLNKLHTTSNEIYTGQDPLSHYVMPSLCSVIATTAFEFFNCIDPWTRHLNNS